MLAMSTVAFELRSISKPRQLEIRSIQATCGQIRGLSVMPLELIVPPRGLLQGFVAAAVDSAIPLTSLGGRYAQGTRQATTTATQWVASRRPGRRSTQKVQGRPVASRGERIMPVMRVSSPWRPLWKDL
jgi:hypothetical protein